MKFSLALILCSYIVDSCIPPYIYPAQFNSEYECLKKGYTESLIKLEEIGEIEVNSNRLYIKFLCYEDEAQEQDT